MANSTEETLRRRIAKLSLKLAHSDQREQFLAQKLAETETKLAAAEAKLAEISRVMKTF